MQKKLHFNLITLLVTAVIVLCACAPAATAPPESTPTPVPTEAPAEPTAEPTTAPEPTATESDVMEFTDSTGTTISFSEAPQRIISLAPSHTELLFAVGAGSQLVGRDAFSDYPAEVLNITDIGGGWSEYDVETIVSLEPDLILSADIVSPEQVEALRGLGLTVFNLGNPVNFEELYETLLLVGELTGHAEEAAATAADLEVRVNTVLDIVAGTETTPLVFYQIDSTDPAAPWTTGPGTFMDTLITLAGGQNVGGVLKDAWAQISLEELIAQNPDIILMGDAVWTAETPDDVAARIGWESMAAVKNGTIFIFDDNLASRPGPRLVDGLELLAQLIHPELFE